MFSMVGTPIGNLSDMSERAKQTLARAEIIYCEDTRVTSKLLHACGIQHAKLIRADEHTIAERKDELLEFLAHGMRVAFVSDAGMPAISDPGMVLMDAVLEAGFPSEVIPGPSAFISAVVASGLPSEHLYFEGFLPRKAQALRTRLTLLSHIPATLVCYESPKRIADTLAALRECMPKRRIAAVRELTKMHEEVWRGTAAELCEYVASLDAVRGEFVIVIDEPTQSEQEQFEQLLARSADTPLNFEEALAQLQGQQKKKSEIAKILAKQFGLTKQDVYERLVEHS